MSPNQSRWAVRAILFAIAVALILDAAVLLARTPKGHAAWLYFRGRAGACTLSQSLEAAELSTQQLAAVERIHSKTALIETDRNGFECWDTPRGRFWMAGGGSTALEYDLAEQDRKIYGGHGRGERRGDVVLDCGANVGVYATAALVAGASLVVAIEPGPENLECLRRNLAKEITERRVIVLEKGVWNKDDTLTLNSDPRNPARDSFYILDGPGIKSVRAHLTTIDNLVATLGLSRVDFIKMDIEGSEKQALQGARETIKKFRPRMAVCTYHRSEDPTTLPSQVRSIEPSYSVTFQGLLTQDQVVTEVAHFSIRR